MIWFAFSVQDQVEKYGAYVGIAAFFGLAVLSLLYFSQARELKRLREWAGRAPERARELEHRVVAQATATVARRAPSAPVTQTGEIAPPRRLAEMPAPAAQTAAGGQATQLAEAVEADPATNGNVPAAVPAVGPGGSVPAGPPANGAATAAPPGDDATDAEPPAAAVPSANGTAAAEPPAVPAEAPAAPEDAAAPPPPVPEPDAPIAPVPGEIPPAPAVPRATPAQRVGVEPRPAAAPLRQNRPTATPRAPAAAGRRPAAPAARRPGAAKPPREGRSAGTIALLVGVAVLILGGGAFVGSQLLGGDDEQTPPNRAAPPPTATEEAGGGNGGGGNGGRPAQEPGETNVAVLNGTTSDGLASGISDRLAEDGYVRGVIQTNGDQTVQDTVVYYADGLRATGEAVAETLSVSEVAALDAETQGLAPEADVVVLAGADQAP